MRTSGSRMLVGAVLYGKTNKVDDVVEPVVRRALRRVLTVAEHDAGPQYSRSQIEENTEL